MTETTRKKLLELAGEDRFIPDMYIRPGFDALDVWAEIAPESGL